MNPTDCKELEDLPNVGPAVAGDLRLLGITRPKQLRDRDPYKLYEKLCRETDERHDPCMIDALISIVRFMNGERAKPWWKYTPERKREMARRAQL